MDEEACGDRGEELRVQYMPVGAFFGGLEEREESLDRFLGFRIPHVVHLERGSYGLLLRMDDRVP